MGKLSRAEVMQVAEQVRAILAARRDIRGGGVVGPSDTVVHSGDLILESDVIVEGELFIVDPPTGSMLASGTPWAVPETPIPE